MKTRAPIAVALSGGVDSATAAALLLDQGHDVLGLTMQLYDASNTRASSGGRCCGPRDIEVAREVCQHLNIPFYVVDFSEEFRSKVVDDFVAAYRTGETPNPCVRCNQFIKFTPLLRRARALGAEVMATGHYARLEEQSGAVLLKRGRDTSKDQSYFLYSMPWQELAHIRFPLGDLRKNEVRELATKYGLPNAGKEDSQEICFVPDGDYAGFVEKVSEKRGVSLPVAGDIVTEDGSVVGRHRGVHRYTLGQRRGLGINLNGEPTYVIAIEPAANRVVVGKQSRAAKPELRVRDFRWLVPTPLGELDCEVQIRHRSTPIECRARIEGTSVHATLSRDALAAPGQSAVFYRDDVVLGGGWIASSATS